MIGQHCNWSTRHWVGMTVGRHNIFQRPNWLIALQEVDMMIGQQKDWSMYHFVNLTIVQCANDRHDNCFTQVLVNITIS